MKRLVLAGLSVVVVASIVAAVAVVAATLQRSPAEASELFNDPVLHVQAVGVRETYRNEDRRDSIIKVFDKNSDPTVLVLYEGVSAEVTNDAFSSIKTHAEEAGWRTAADRPEYWSARKAIGGYQAFVDVTRASNTTLTLNATLNAK